MTATVLPFPVARRRALVLRTAARMADLTHESAERHLAHQAQIQADTFSRKGVAPALIASELRAFQGAVRAELWRMVLAPGGAA